MVLGIGRAIKREAKRAEKKVRKEVKRTGRRVGKEVERAAEVIGHPVARGIEETIGEVGEVLSPDITITTPEEPTPIPMPDEELARVARRRSMAKRRRGRSASILTGADTLG